MGCPTPYGQSQNRCIFLSPTRCKGEGHIFCPINTKFSVLNIFNAQNCWVIFQKLALKTCLWHEPSNFNGSWEKSDILKVTYISELWTTFLKVTHSLGHPKGLLLPFGTPCIKLHVCIWPIGWSGRRASKFNEYAVLAVKQNSKISKYFSCFTKKVITSSILVSQWAITT